MAVEVFPLNILGMSGAGMNITSFSDNFNRANINLGRNWASGAYGVPTPITTPIGGPSASIQANAFAWAYNGVNNPLTNWCAFAMPVPGNLYQNLYGKTQFSQATFITDNNQPTSNFGVSVLQSLDNATFYVVAQNLVAGPTRSVTLVRVTAPVTPYQFSITVLQTIRPATGFAANEIVRISADMSLAPAQVTITVKINAVTVATFVDVTPITIGSPGLAAGFFADQFAQNGVGVWDDYSCGLGL